MLRNPFGGDATEAAEEYLRQLGALQDTLGQTAQELKSRLESLTAALNEVEIRQSGLENTVRQSAASLQQELQNLWEAERIQDENLGALQEREQQIETKLAQLQGVLPASGVRIENSLQLLRQFLEEKLRAQAERLDALEKTLSPPLERLDEWRQTLPPADSSQESAWLNTVVDDLNQLETSGQLRGNARLFACRLAESLQQLREWEVKSAEIPADALCEEEAVQEMDRKLFRPHLDVAWVEIGDTECEPRARAELRMLETAWINYRCRLQKRLQERHDFRPIHIVPGETRFDPDRHETTEFFTTPTADRERDNRIIGVERNGYQIGARVLRRALVRRYLWNKATIIEDDELDAAATGATPAETATNDAASLENEAAPPAAEAQEDPMKKGF